MELARANANAEAGYASALQLTQYLLFAYAAPSSISRMMMLKGTPSSQRMIGMARLSEPLWW